MDARRLLRDRRHARLLARAKAGDARSFRRLYLELYDSLSSYLGPRLAEPMEVEDLLSKVFHGFIEKLGDYDASRGCVQAWLLSMARNALIDHWRVRKAQLPIDEVANILADGAADPLQAIVDDENARFVNGILADHPPEIREMFALRFGQGLRYRDIALCMGMSESAVKQRFSRSLRELRQKTRRRNDKQGEVDYAI